MYCMQSIPILFYVLFSIIFLYPNRLFVLNIYSVQYSISIQLNSFYLLNALSCLC